MELGSECVEIKTENSMKRGALVQIDLGPSTADAVFMGGLVQIMIVQYRLQTCKTSQAQGDQ